MYIIASRLDSLPIQESKGDQNEIVGWTLPHLTVFPLHFLMVEAAGRGREEGGGKDSRPMRSQKSHHKCSPGLPFPLGQREGQATDGGGTGTLPQDPQQPYKCPVKKNNNQYTTDCHLFRAFAPFLALLLLLPLSFAPDFCGFRDTLFVSSSTRTMCNPDRTACKKSCPGAHTHECRQDRIRRMHECSLECSPPRDTNPQHNTGIP